MIKDVISFSIPRKPDYISLVRLTASGIAHSMALNINDIEDLKVSIGEACLNALTLNKTEEISLVFEIDEEKICIKVNDVKEDIPIELDQSKERELGLLIIRSLMDEVEFNEDGIQMIKYVEDDSQ